MIGGYHVIEYKDIWETEVAIEAPQCQREMGNRYDVYMPVMQPTFLLATMIALTMLKVHWDQANNSITIAAFLKVLQ